MSRPFEIIPGILTHSLPEFRERLDLVEQSRCEWAHVDIMDGQFVPQISVMPHELSGLKTRLQLEAHLMAFRPERYYADLLVAGISRVLIHREAFGSLEATASAVRAAASYFNEVGLVINPETSVEPLQELPLQVIQCMGVQPGAAGQPFVEAAYGTIAAVAKQGLPAVLAADGSVGQPTILPLRDAGITRFVINSKLFAGAGIDANLQHFTSMVTGNT